MQEHGAAKEDGKSSPAFVPEAYESVEDLQAREMPYAGRKVRLIFDSNGPSLRDVLLDYFSSLQ